MRRKDLDLEVGGQPPDELTKDAICELLGCSEKTLRDWQRLGLQSRRRRGRLWFLRADLEAFLRGR